jgi:hypothetical protein
MGHRVLAAVSVTTTLLLGAAVAPSLAQGQLPRPGQLPPPGGHMGPPQRGQMGPPQRGQMGPPQRGQPAQQAQQAAPPRPYKPVAITAPAPMKDPSFDAFRKQIGAVAERKDRRALAGMVVANGFFWLGEKGDKADKRRSGMDNLAKALGLNAQDGAGWDSLADHAADPTAMPYPDRKDTFCSPAEPDFNGEQFEALVKATGTEEGEWGYPMQPGLEVRSGPQPNAPVIEKLGMHFVRVMEDSGQGNQANPVLRVVAPSGRVGYVPADAISPLGNDQICYAKTAGGWKIVGVVGGAEQ